MRVLQAKKRADERTRTADLLITSDPSRVAGGCTGLQIPHFYGGFLSAGCCVLHGIALPVVSEWYQHRPSSRATPSTRTSYFRPESGKFSAMRFTGERRFSPYRGSLAIWGAYIYRLLCLTLLASLPRKGPTASLRSCLSYPSVKQRRERHGRAKLGSRNLPPSADGRRRWENGIGE